jgi:methylmalonyl-CoA mutase C-terminal domain/subunit
MTTEEKKIRVLLTIARFDGHDRGVRYLGRKLGEAGMEVIFTRFVTPEDIVKAAMEEDVAVIGISFSVGGHKYVSLEVMKRLKENGMDIPVMLGGVIPDDEHQELTEIGVSRIFGPGSYAEDIVKYIHGLE